MTAGLPRRATALSEPAKRECAEFICHIEQTDEACRIGRHAGASHRRIRPTEPLALACWGPSGSTDAAGQIGSTQGHGWVALSMTKNEKQGVALLKALIYFSMPTYGR